MLVPAARSGEVDVIPSNANVSLSLGSSVRRGCKGGVATALALTLGGGCMTLTPQLPPTDFAALEQVEDREERERIYAEEQIYTRDLPQGKRYVKGTDVDQTPRSWQSLDVVLRSDANAAAALPTRQLRRSRLFAALTVAAGILTVAGAAASAREGLNLGEIDPAGGVLLGAGLATVGFAITSGVFYGKSRRGYEQAVDVYNDSLGMRLGILDGHGNYIPPRGALVDADGNIVLDPDAPRPAGAPLPAPVAAEPVAAPQPEASAAPEPEAEAPAEADAPAEAETPAAPEAVAAPEAPAPEADAPAPEVAVPPPGLASAGLRLRPRL